MYRKHFNTKATPQSKPIPGKKMVKNEAGGYVFQVDDWKRLDRFLILGTEKGTYYATEQKLTIQSAEVVLRCMNEDGHRLVDRIVEISDGGRAPKNDPALFALAICAGMGNDEVRKAALDVLPKVARIGTHLFHFIEFVEGFRGWGRGLRSAVANWYTAKEPDALVYQLIKYQQRDGWAQNDLVRLSHVKSDNPIFKWLVKGDVPEWVEDSPKWVRIINAFEMLKKATDEKEVIGLVAANSVPWEAVPTQWLKSKNVWRALLPKLPLEAMLRNLGRLTSIGVLEPMGFETSLVYKYFTDEEFLQRSRLHPMKILVALRTYETGHGVKGDLSWMPIHEIVDALDESFYKAFKNAEPTGKRIMFAIDASGSMTYPVSGAPNLTCRQGAVALSLVGAAIEKSYMTVAFTEGQHIVPLTISPKMRLNDAIRELERKVIPQGTDVSLPIRYALQNQIQVDAFVILTDNQTWSGNIHPVQILKQYRQHVNPKVKLVVVAMAVNDISVGDSKDFQTLDVVGFDTATPQVISDFIANE